MTSELVLSLKSRKLAPLKPAPITSGAAMLDQNRDRPAKHPQLVDRPADNDDNERQPESRVNRERNRAVTNDHTTLRNEPPR